MKDKKYNLLLACIAVVLCISSFFLGYVCNTKSRNVTQASTNTEQASPISQQTPTNEQQEPTSSQSKEYGYSIDSLLDDKLASAISNIEKSEAYRQVAELWKKEVDLNYQKLLLIANEPLQQALSAEHKAWEDTLLVKKELNLRYLQQIYMSGSIVPVLQAKYEYALYRERAVVLYEMYERVHSITSIMFSTTDSSDG